MGYVKGKKKRTEKSTGRVAVCMGLFFHMALLRETALASRHD
jgi:hypothetical protein